MQLEIHPFLPGGGSSLDGVDGRLSSNGVSFV